MLDDGSKCNFLQDSQRRARIHEEGKQPMYELYTCIVHTAAATTEIGLLKREFPNKTVSIMHTHTCTRVTCCCYIRVQCNERTTEISQREISVLTDESYYTRASVCCLHAQQVIDAIHRIRRAMSFFRACGFPYAHDDDDCDRKSSADDVRIINPSIVLSSVGIAAAAEAKRVKGVLKFYYTTRCYYTEKERG